MRSSTPALSRLALPSTALAVVAAHGLSRLAAVRLAQAAGVAVVVISPILLLASAVLPALRARRERIAVEAN